MKYIITILIVVSMPVICHMQTNNIKVEIKYLFTLVNKNETQKKEYLFAKPAYLEIDKENNVYVGELLGSEIRKYTQNGKYLKTLGRAGKGPGEFETITNYDIREDKMLIQGSMYKISEYSVANNKFMNYILPGKLGYITRAWYYPEDKILINKYDKDVKNDKIFFIYDRKLEKLSNSFCYANDLFEVNSPYRLNELNKLKMLILDNGNVFVTKKYYDGKLHKYDAKNNMSHSISNRKGYSYRTPLYLNPLSNDDLKTSRFWSITKNSKTNRQTGFTVRTFSAGIIKYENKYILNLVFQDFYKKVKGRDYEAGFEIYSIEGAYLGYCKIEQDLFYGAEKSALLGIDNKNCIYLVCSEKADEKVLIDTIRKYQLKTTIN